VEEATVVAAMAELVTEAVGILQADMETEVGHEAALAIVGRTGKEAVASVNFTVSNQPTPGQTKALNPY
jgi:hypothetical protein